MAPPAVLLDIPLFLELPVPDTQGIARHLLVVAGIRIHDGNHVRVDVSWNETSPPPPIPPARIMNLGGMYAPALPNVHIMPTGNFLSQPIYIRVDRLTGLWFPHPLLIAITATEWIPGDPVSLGVQADIKFITNMASSSSTLLRVARNEVDQANEDEERAEDRAQSPHGWGA